MPVFLAAYGTLMTGQVNQLAPAVRHRMHPVGPCRIPGRLYLVRTQRAYEFPALVMSPGVTTQGE
ncbi:MAG: gamma-glutamylcyclotransferase, partial [Rhodospirillales bacterium]|nr:gamma-glutamylcyclotransferase [Acetobacter sp.]